MKGVNSCSTEHFTGTAAPGRLQQNPQAIIVSNLELMKASLLKLDPQGGSVQRSTVGPKQANLHPSRAEMKPPP